MTVKELKPGIRVKCQKDGKTITGTIVWQHDEDEFEGHYEDGDLVRIVLDEGVTHPYHQDKKWWTIQAGILVRYLGVKQI